LRLVLAVSRNCDSLIDSYIFLEAPLREDFPRLPRLADNAAPAAICCFFDLAGIALTRILGQAYLKPVEPAGKWI
jgi:hypothetical protein